jgi:hypothetical protein
MMNMDCIYVETPGGPRKIKYCLYFVDSFSCWPTVFLLSSLTAKALSEMFATIGILEVIWSDLGTNFMSNLTQQF